MSDALPPNDSSNGETTPNELATIRKVVRYQGHVQGVNFRRSAARVAESYDVVGLVRNLRDGRVELIAEAQRTILDQFLDAVAEVMSGHIDDTEVAVGIATGEFRRFTIRVTG